MERWGYLFEWVITEALFNEQRPEVCVLALQLSSTAAQQRKQQGYDA